MNQPTEKMTQNVKQTITFKPETDNQRIQNEQNISKNHPAHIPNGKSEEKIRSNVKGSHFLIK
jgi:hypothetical protein